MQLINTEIRIETASTCNSNCTICPREKMTRPKVIMPINHFKYLVNQAKDLGAELISIFGYGEPLMDAQIADKVAYCKDFGTFITTNASLLNMDMTYKLLEAGLSHIRFSVHGLFDDYEQVHRGLKFNDVVRNIRNFKAVVRIKQYDCKVSITCIPMNGENIDDIINFWDGYELEVWKPHGWSGARNYRTLVRKKKTCGRPQRGPVQINADGTMIICCYDTDAKMTVGDTYKSSIEQILKGKEYNRIRKCHETGNLDGLACDSCDQLNQGDNPLIYSTIDKDCITGKTSSTKFQLEAA